MGSTNVEQNEAQANQYTPRFPYISLTLPMRKMDALDIASVVGNQLRRHKVPLEDRLEFRSKINMTNTCSEAFDIVKKWIVIKRRSY